LKKSVPVNNAAFVGAIPENYDRTGSVLSILTPKIWFHGSVLNGRRCWARLRHRHCHPASARKAGPHALVATGSNEAMLDYAQRKFEAPAGIEWQQADATDLQFPDQSFDAVVCQFGLMFFPTKRKPRAKLIAS
jgi:hypothetical protein